MHLSLGIPTRESPFSSRTLTLQGFLLIYFPLSKAMLRGNRFNSSSSGPRGNSAFISGLWPKDKQSQISSLTPLEVMWRFVPSTSSARNHNLSTSVSKWHHSKKPEPEQTALGSPDPSRKKARCCEGPGEQHGPTWRSSAGPGAAWLFFFPFFFLMYQNNQKTRTSQSLSTITVLHRGLVRSEQSIPAKPFKVALIFPKRCCL